MYICIYVCVYIYAAVSNVKRKAEAQESFSLIRFPFTHCVNGSYPFANWLNGINGLNGLAHPIYYKLHFTTR